MYLTLKEQEGVRHLEVKYKNNKIRRECEEYKFSVRSYGKLMADKIHHRIGQIEAIDTVELLIQYSVGRCHELEGNRKGFYAMDLIHPYRLVFKVERGYVQIATISEVVDYH